VFKSLKPIAEDLLQCLVLLKYTQDVSSLEMWNNPETGYKGPRCLRHHGGGRHLQVDEGLRAFGSHVLADKRDTDSL